MKIVEKRIDAIKPYKNNPRHNDNAVGAVAESIREFGFKVPIIIDCSGEIVAGHTRHKAARTDESPVHNCRRSYTGTNKSVPARGQ